MVYLDVYARMWMSRFATCCKSIVDDLIEVGYMRY